MDTSEIPRHVPTNLYNYTKVEQAKRSKALIDIERDFPNVPKLWAEWMYDVIGHMSETEVEDIINTGAWEKPSEMFSIAKGGTIKCAEVSSE